MSDVPFTVLTCIVHYFTHDNRLLENIVIYYAATQTISFLLNFATYIYIYIYTDFKVAFHFSTFLKDFYLLKYLCICIVNLNNFTTSFIMSITQKYGTLFCCVFFFAFKKRGIIKKSPTQHKCSIRYKSILIFLITSSMGFMFCRISLSYNSLI